MKEFTNEQEVKIDGPINYGGTTTRVASRGIIKAVYKNCCLVNISYIDGDFNANVIVPNRYIK